LVHYRLVSGDRETLKKRWVAVCEDIRALEGIALDAEGKAELAALRLRRQGLEELLNGRPNGGQPVAVHRGLTSRDRPQGSR